jgi:DNA-binding GntR family transcriptional regulator
MKFINSSQAEATTLASTLAAKLRHAITQGELVPGTKLRLEDLKTSFGVSLSPLREALSRLGAEGFVVMEDQRGYRVAPVSEANLREVLALRIELECFALRQSIALGDGEWEAAIVAALHRLNRLKSTDPGRDIPAWEEAHRRFHLGLIAGGGMPLLTQFCTTLHDLADRYRRLFLARHPPDRNVPEEHEKIASAAIHRRADEACRLLAQHIERTGRGVMAVLAAERDAQIPR